jgi:hypothetical protein
MRMIDTIKENKSLLIIPVILFVVLLLILSLRGSSKNYKTAGDTVSASTIASLKYNNALYFATNVNASDSLLGEDITFFARKNYQVYNPDKPIAVIFNIASKPSTNGKTISFSGSYEKVKNKIEVTVTILRNNRIKTSIKDAKTGTEIDSLLPSNNKTNLYIQSLPITYTNYRIYYSLVTNKVTINLNRYSPDLKQQALTQLIEATSSNFVNDQNVNVYHAVSPADATGHVDYIKDSVVSK